MDNYGKKIIINKCYDVSVNVSQNLGNIYVLTRAGHVGLRAILDSLVSVSLRQVGQWRNHFETLDIGTAK